jgi:hypothetical protein
MSAETGRNVVGRSERQEGSETHGAVSRRTVLNAGAMAAVGAAAGIAGAALPFASGGAEAQTNAHAAGAGTQASNEAFRQKTHDVRVAAAAANRQVAIPPHPTNGDEEAYANKIGSDTRGLPHDARGEVNLEAFRASLKAYVMGDPIDFERIPLGGTRKQLNPLGSLAVSLSGLNAVQFAIPPAPALASAIRAGEAVELYWQALLRDVPLAEFRNDTSNKDVLAAVDELNKLSAFHGPKADGRVTPETLFRGTALYVDQADASGRTGKYVVPPGSLAGPYVSQLLFRDVPFATQTIPAQIRSAAPGVDYLTDYDEWLRVQNGTAPRSPTKLEATRRYIATGRDVAEYVHNAPAAFIAAALLLTAPVNRSEPASGGFGAPLNPSNPYVRSKTPAAGVSTFGLGYLQSLQAQATSIAIRVAYWQKFYVHRALRPEAYAGLVHHRIANNVDSYPVGSEILNSQALACSFSKHGTYLLPHVYPEGAPIHSSYPGGAAIIAAANATLLKAFFDEDHPIESPVEADPKDPTRLTPYTGAPLTVGGELNKLAVNYAIGRDWAGIHWRSDFSASFALGEDLAISLLRDERPTVRESFEGFTFTRFDGTKITV